MLSLFGHLKGWLCTRCHSSRAPSLSARALSHRKFLLYLFTFVKYTTVLAIQEGRKERTEMLEGNICSVAFERS